MRIMNKLTGAAGLVAAAVAAGALLLVPAAGAVSAGGQPEGTVTIQEFVVEGPFNTADACQHRAQFWDQINGRHHWCVYHDGSGGYNRGYWVYSD